MTSPGRPLKLLGKGGTRVRGNADRDGLLIKILFVVALRISEAIGLGPVDIIEQDRHPRLRILGKGRRRAVVRVSASLVSKIKTYA